MMAELRGAAYAVVTAVVASTVEALAHFDEIIVVATYCSCDWDDLRDISLYG